MVPLPREHVGSGALYHAPGKVVISGAYSVLYGAPCVVSAVDRYATADPSRIASSVTAEVRCALGAEPAPWFDARRLRRGNRKLGLGSSAAILVASLGAYHRQSEEPFLSRELFPRALVAHRLSQGGGSGVDVAVACYGGTRSLRRRGDGLDHHPVALPTRLVLEVWASLTAASSPLLVGRVRALEQARPREHSELIERLGVGADATHRALLEGHTEQVIEGLRQQFCALERLGAAAESPIITPQVASLHQLAEREGAVVLPAGAGGGDIAFYASLKSPSHALRAAMSKLGHSVLKVQLGARGLHASGGPGPTPLATCS